MKIKLIAIICFVSWANTFGQTNDRPNILIIYADDLGYGDLSIYGGDIPTPNIDRIGKEGIKFTDFYVAGPVCTPSRFGLLTGSYPVRSKQNLYTALMPFDKNHLDATEKILPEYLRELHYKTALIGKWHLGSENAAFPTKHGFDLFTGLTGGCIDFYDHIYGTVEDDWYVDGKLTKETGYATELIANHAVDFFQEVKTQKQPFFLFLSFNAPHYGKTDPKNVPPNSLVLKEETYEGYSIANTLQAPKEYLDRFAHVNDPYRRVYAAMVSSLDDNVGKVLRELDKSGLSNNTVIWFISDNGGYSESYHGHASNGKLRGQKGTLYEGGIRVPGLLSWKGKVKAGQVISDPVCNVDLLPTFASILKFNDRLAGKSDGIDLSSLLFNGTTTSRSLFWKFGNQSALREGQWKMVNGTELYNLNDDLSEKNNLASTHPEKLKELNRQHSSIEASAKNENPK